MIMKDEEPKVYKLVKTNSALVCIKINTPFFGNPWQSFLIITYMSLRRNLTNHDHNEKINHFCSFNIKKWDR